jgi:hypothetical protein
LTFAPQRRIATTFGSRREVVVVKDVTISLEDRPGTLADVGEALGRAGINIEGFCGMAVDGRGVMHVLVEDAAAARIALDAAGVKVEGEADPIVMELEGEVDRPGALGEMARRVADAGVNVQVVYIGTRSRGVIVTSDNDKALAAMG